MENLVFPILSHYRIYTIESIGPYALQNANFDFNLNVNFEFILITRISVRARERV